MAATTRFRAAVEARDLAAVSAALHADVRFASPVAHRPYLGREQVTTLLGLVMQVMPDLRYTRELDDGPNGMLLFAATVDDREVQGVDLVVVGEDGLVAELVVMVRPLSAATALKEAMGRALEALAAQG